MNRIARILAAVEAESSDDVKKGIAWNNVPGVPGTTFKLDCDRNWIAWEEYGKYTDYGWQIDHTMPVAFGGSDTSSNLRARHWRGNSRAGGFAGSLLDSSVSEANVGWTKARSAPCPHDV